MKKLLYLLLLLAFSLNVLAQRKWEKMRILPLDFLDANTAVLLWQSDIRMFDQQYVGDFKNALLGLGVNISTIGLESDVMYSPTDMDTMITKGGEPKYFLDFYDDGLLATLDIQEYSPEAKDNRYGKTLMHFSDENLELLLQKFGKRINELKAEHPKADKQSEYNSDSIKIVSVYGEVPAMEVIVGFPESLKDIKLNFMEREFRCPEKNKLLDDWNSEMRKQMLEYPFHLKHYKQSSIVEQLDNAERYFYGTSMERRTELYNYREQNLADFTAEGLGLPEGMNVAPINVQKYYVRSYIVDLYDNKIYAGEPRFIDKNSYLVYKYFIVDMKQMKKGKYDYPKIK